MADQFSSADKQISISGGAAGAPRKINPQKMLDGMTKDVRKRWMIVGVGAVVSMSVIAGWMSSSVQPRAKRLPPSAAIDTTPRGLSAQKDWRAQTGAELKEMRQALAESQAGQRELLARMEAMRQELSNNNNKGSGAAPVHAPRIDFNIPAPPEPPKSIARQQPNTPAASAQVYPLTPPSPGGYSATAAPAPAAKRAPARGFIPAGVDADLKAAASRAKVQEDMVTNDRMGFLPAGSFAAATLISGVEAFTGGTAASQPQPLVVRVDENAILPNAGRYQLKGCHVLASVWGDMSSERVFGRTATLTCVDVNDKLVLSEEVEGVLIDSDGKNGLRGILQDRQGAKLARSLLAGFAQGMSAAFGAAQSTVTANPFGGATSSIMGSNAVAAAGYQGASSASKTLADYYLKQAEATLPVIAVDAGRKASVLFTKSKSLKFETTGAYRVKQKSTVRVEREAD